MKRDRHASLPSPEAIELAENVYHSVQRIFAPAIADFEAKWTAFQDVCKPKPTSASISACTQTNEFKALERLGPRIIQCIVFKLATDNTERKLHGVVLFNALEKDLNYRGNSQVLPTSKKALQQLANEIVTLNYQRNEIYDKLVIAWKQHCEKNKAELSRAIVTGCKEYFDLVEVGPSFIPHLLLEYHGNRGGYWYELLHEIVHGHHTGAQTIFGRNRLFDRCRDFFNSGADYDQAPKHNPAQLEILKAGPAILDVFLDRYQLQNPPGFKARACHVVRTDPLRGNDWSLCDPQLQRSRVVTFQNILIHPANEDTPEFQSTDDHAGLQLL